MESRRPYVTLSYAQSADGRIATLNGSAERISGQESTEFAHTLRRDNQAIMVGIGTVLADDPLLNCRLPEGCPSPVRVIIDSKLRLPPDSRIAQSAETYHTILFCAEDSITAHQQQKRVLEKHKIEIVQVGTASAGRLSLPEILNKLGKMGFSSLFVEGGAALITSFFAEDLVDRLYIVSAPIIIGSGTEAVGELRTHTVKDARRGRTASVRQVGNDIIWDITFRHTSEPPDTATALYFTQPYSVEIRTEPLQRNSRTLLIESQVIGISHGSESHLYRNTFPAGRTEDKVPGIDERMSYPLKYGYMNAGRTPRGEKVFAFFPHQNRFYYPQDELIYFPESADFKDIVLYPSVETAFTIVLDTAPLPGERILIIGQGMIGLLIAEILSEHPGLHIAALEPDFYRRRLSTQLGLPTADPSNLEPADLRQSVQRLFHAHLPDKIIHVSGTACGLQQAIDCADFETLVIEASWHGNRPVQLNLGENFHRKRLTIRSSQVSTLSSTLGSRWNRGRRTEEVKEWVQRISPSKYVTHRFPLSQAHEAYRLLFGESGVNPVRGQADRPGAAGDSTAPREPVLQALLIPEGSEIDDPDRTGPAPQTHSERTQ